MPEEHTLLAQRNSRFFVHREFALDGIHKPLQIALFAHVRPE